HTFPLLQMEIRSRFCRRADAPHSICTDYDCCWRSGACRRGFTCAVLATPIGRGGTKFYHLQISHVASPVRSNRPTDRRSQTIVVDWCFNSENLAILA